MSRRRIAFRLLVLLVALLQVATGPACVAADGRLAAREATAWTAGHDVVGEHVRPTHSPLCVLCQGASAASLPAVAVVATFAVQSRADPPAAPGAVADAETPRGATRPRAPPVALT